MPFYPAPSIPVGVLRFKIRYAVQPPSQQEAFIDFDFRGDFIPTHFDLNLSTWLVEIKNNWIIPVFNGIFPHPWIFSIGLHAFYNHGPSTIGTTITYPVTFIPTGKPITSTLCPCFTRRTIQGDRNGIGRCFGPPVPDSFITAGDFNATAIAAYDQSRFFQARFWNGQGVKWTPCVYSPSTNVVNDILKVELVHRPRTIYRHRNIAPYTRPTVAYLLPHSY